MSRWSWWRRRSSEAPERAHFDAAFYCAANPDVEASGVDAFAHFMSHGWHEGRNPSRSFLNLYYRDKYLDGLRINPLTHFTSSVATSRLPTMPAGETDYVAIQKPLARPYFSDTYYRSQVVSAVADPLGHYLLTGWRAGLAPSQSFDPNRYLALHPYVSDLDVCPLYHFASQKRFQMRKQGGEIKTLHQLYVPNLAEDTEAKALVATRFDTNYYLYENDDVRAAGADPLDHFMRHGWRENRKPDRTFDCAYYTARYPDVAESGINPYYHYLAVGEAAGLRQNPFGQFAYPPLVAPTWDAWSSVQVIDPTEAECAIVMPVYKGYDETLASIHSILSAPQRTRFVLLVIDDCSPDNALSEALALLGARGLFLYERHQTNLGFVATANEGMRRFTDKIVILLNTDTQVFGDWLDRLVAHARRDPSVATVTPLSNNATIASYPLRNVNNEIQVETDAAGLDRLASSCNAGRASEIPVGIGFCLLVSASSRAAIGLLDEDTFGRGYGDENDFCMRASRAGLRNVLAEDVFVYHVGEVSFGAPQAKRRVRGQAELVAKHPHYPELIKQHFNADPTEHGRIRLDLKRLAVNAGPGVEVHVDHAQGGGIATHVDYAVASAMAAGRSSIRMRVAVDGPWNIEICSASATAPYCPNLRPFSVTQFRQTLLDFLDWLAPSVIHIHSVAGLSWQATQSLFDIVRDSSVPYDVTLHDYAAFCHRHNLVQPSGHYCGLATVEVCRVCVATDRSYPEGLDPALRRHVFARFLEGAARVIAPSSDVKERFERVGVGFAIDVVPHREGPTTAPVYIAPRDPTTVRIVTIGAIGTHKGSRVIASLARDAAARGLPLTYAIIGYSDIGGEMAELGVTETGRYESIDEAYALLVSAEPAAILLPSIWPETYCYTLSMAFALGCPPIVFDLGAQAARVREKGLGFVVPTALVHDIRALNDHILHVLSSR